MKRISGLVLILSVFWMINSGLFHPLLLGIGLISVLGVLLISLRMEVVDGTYQSPVILSARLPSNLFWLLQEIILSNFDVIRRIWQRNPDLSPTVFTIKASQQSDVCRALYANFITMTPGTVTMDVQGDTFTVHALTRATAEKLKQGEMDRRVSTMEK